MMLNRVLAFVSLYCFGCVALAAAEIRLPWEWTDSERIASLTDPAAAAARVRLDRASDGSSIRYQVGGSSGDNTAAEPHDVISGSRDPHLFFAFELFEHAVKLAYADDPRTRVAYREALEEERKALGLPDDLWARLEVMTAAYRADRREERRIGLSNLADVGKHAALNANYALLCRDRRAALKEAEKAFGRTFIRFLYTAVAPTLKRTILRRVTAEELQALVNGECE